ncbi:MAG: hypothetical protein U0797_00710 [Gemmataceae bacterium]
MTHRETLYTQLLPTLGGRVVPALIRRLESAAHEGDYLLVASVEHAIVSTGDEAVSGLALGLLNKPPTSVQRAAMRVLSRRPTPKALDLLWAIHKAAVAEPEKYLREREHKYSAYEDSFGALRACVRLDPAWLEQTILGAGDSEPVHDLAYLLAGLPAGEALWRRVKTTLFAKVRPENQRSLATNIHRWADAEEVDWVRERVDAREHLIGPWAFRALIRIDPDLAVRELPRLPAEYVGSTVKWCLGELIEKRPEAARDYLLGTSNSSLNVNALTAVYGENEAWIDEKTLSAFCTRLDEVLDEEMASDDQRQPSLIALCDLLGGLDRVDHLDYLARQAGGPLEEKLTHWLLRRGPQRGQWMDPVLKDALHLLEKMGGEGFTRVVNSYLAAGEFWGRWLGIEHAAKRSDAETVRRLASISLRDELHEGVAMEQGYATLALHALGESHAVVISIMRWGLFSLEQIVRRLTPDPFDDGAMAPAFRELDARGSSLEGALLAVGVGGRSDRLDLVRAIMKASPPEAGTSLAGAITLGILRDGSPEALELLRRQAAVPNHLFETCRALCRIPGDQPLHLLCEVVERQFDDRFAIRLLTQPAAETRAVGILRARLATVSGDEKLTLITRLLLAVADRRLIDMVLDNEPTFAFLHEAAFASEAVPCGVEVRRWRSAHPGPIRRVGVGGGEGQRRPSSKDEIRYPSLLMELDRRRRYRCSSRAVRAEPDERVVEAAGRAEPAGTHRSGGGGEMIGELLADRVPASARRRPRCWGGAGRSTATSRDGSRAEARRHGIEVWGLARERPEEIPEADAREVASATTGETRQHRSGYS